MFEVHERGGLPCQTASTSVATGTGWLAWTSSTASRTRGPMPGSTISVPSGPWTVSGPSTLYLISWPPPTRPDGAVDIRPAAAQDPGPDDAGGDGDHEDAQGDEAQRRAGCGAEQRVEVGHGDREDHREHHRPDGRRPGPLPPALAGAADPPEEPEDRDRRAEHQ